MKPITCFKAYDIRGRVPEQLNTDVAYRIGRAFAQILSAKYVVVGHDIRLTSPELTDALVEGILDAGCDVMHIGQCGTEEVYFSTFHYDLDGGICVTASHNPMDYNGMKLVRSGSRPISGDSGLFDIQALAESEAFDSIEKRGTLTHVNNRSAFVEHLLTYVSIDALAKAQTEWLERPLKVVVNAGNGGAGLVIDALEAHLPFDFIKVHHEPNGEFPNGIPNPLLPENRGATADAVIEHKADLGIAWDGDFDRCFFFDAQGRFLEGYYLVGLLAQAFLDKHPQANIVHDPRLTWNTQAMVEASGGTPIQSKTGHAFIKERMRKEDAVYGGEMSAHHYFKDFAYCDSGMIPWLLVCELMLVQKKTLAQMVDDRMAAFPCSGEINRKVKDADDVLAQAKVRYANDAVLVESVDGLSVAYHDWRFNLRKSNTEPVIRLNVESRVDERLMREKTEEILHLVDSL